MSRQRYATNNQNTVSLAKERASLGPISNAVLVLVMACLIGMIYLAQVTKTNSFSYEIDRLNQRQAQLKEDQKNLDLTAARLRSVDSAAVSKASERLVSSQPVATLN